MYKNYFVEDQLRLKLLTRDSLKLTNIHLNMNLFKVSNVVDNQILEGLFLLENFSGYKSYINYYKKSFKETNIQISNDLQKKNIYYFILLLQFFYLPILQRRNIVVDSQKTSVFVFNYSIGNINLIPFVPDIYFKWKIPINCFFNFSYKDQKAILLYLEYLGFIFAKKN